MRGLALVQSLPFTDFRYDDAGRLVNLAHAKWWTLASYIYTLDAAGNRLAVAEYVLLPIAMNNYSGTVGGGYAPQGSGTTFMSPLPIPEEQFSAPTPLLSPLPTPEANRLGGKSGLASIAPIRPSSRWVPAGLGPTTFLSPMGNPPPCSGGLPTFGSSVVITYTYDPLRRLTSATYSSGACFLHDYDAGGNVTQSTEVVTATRITNYTCNLASQLSTSKVDVESTTWYYAFDNNGNLREMTPNGSAPTNTASQLIKVGAHNGSSNAEGAERSRNGGENRTG